MNKKELKINLDKRKVPVTAYSLEGGFPNEAYCIGFSNDLWEVYYSERGRKSGLKLFDNEDEACNYFFNLLCDLK